MDLIAFTLNKIFFKKYYGAVALLILSFIPTTSLFAQEIIQDYTATYKAKVEKIISAEEKIVPGTNISSVEQTFEATILDGSMAGEKVTVVNDYVQLREGSTFYMLHTVRAEDGKEFFSVYDPNRIPSLLFFVLMFVVAVFVFGGWQGIRGLLSLAGSLFVIIYILLPGVLSGFSPLLVSIGVSSIIIIVGSYITHGFNKTTTSAVIGMILTVILTGILAYFSVYVTYLTGFESHEATYLNFATDGNLDFVGLLLGGIMIGLLGVLYDVAIGQAISVEELHAVGPHLSKKIIYKRALRIGREHIGALVNTLAIAYVGASLPLLLLFYSSEASTILTLNREIFATEIVRTMIGSIGLVFAVPITTVVAVLMLIKKNDQEQEVVAGLSKEEEEALDAVTHVHHH